MIGRVCFARHDGGILVLDSLGHAALNALAAHVAVLDRQGRILIVNEAWRRFARENGGDPGGYVGANYLDACGAAARRGDTVASGVVQGIRDVLDGVRDSYSVDYPLLSQDRELWFETYVRPFRHEAVDYLIAVHVDRTARREAESRLRHAEGLLRNVLETLPVGVWIMDAQGLILQGNAEAQRIWAGARFVGPDQYGVYKGWWLGSREPIAPDEWAGARAIRNGETVLGEEILIECFDGSRKIIVNSAMPLRDETGRITGAISVDQDITARKEDEARLYEASAALDATNHELQVVLAREQRNARTDELTGLSNRRHFYELANELFAVAERYRVPLSVLLFDVDRFKQFNDRFGHQAGDNALETIAREASRHKREADVLARYGGEEFIMALPNTDIAGARILAETIRDWIAGTRVPIDGKGTTVTVSVGVAEVHPGDDAIDRAICRADAALYEAKAAGRNCTRVHAVI